MIAGDHRHNNHGSKKLVKENKGLIQQKTLPSFLSTQKEGNKFYIHIPALMQRLTAIMLDF